MLKLDKRFHPDFSQPGRKPTGAVEIDLANSIQSKIVKCEIFNYQAAAGSTKPIRGTGGVYSLAAKTTPKNGMVFGSSAGRVRYLNDPLQERFPWKTTRDFFVAFDIEFSSLPTVDGSVYGMFDSTVDPLLIWYDVGGASKSIAFAICNSGTINKTGEDGPAISAGRRYHYCMNYTGSEMQIWRDGIKVSSVPSTLQPDYTTSLHAATGTQNAESTARTLLNSKINYLYVGNQSLSSAEIKSLHSDPYQILKPANDLYYFPVPDGGGGTTHEVSAAFSQSFGVSTAKTADYNASAAFSQSFGMSQGANGTLNTSADFAQIFDSIASTIATLNAQAQTGITSGFVANYQQTINADAVINVTHSASAGATQTTDALADFLTQHGVSALSGTTIQAAAQFAVNHALQTGADISIEALADFSVSCGLLCSAVNEATASADFGMVSGVVAETVAILNAQAQLGITSGVSVTRTFTTDAGISCSITSSFTASGAIQVIGSVTTPGSRTMTILAENRTLTITLENRTLTIEE